jgi:hypothetical protein
MFLKDTHRRVTNLGGVQCCRQEPFRFLEGGQLPMIEQELKEADMTAILTAVVRQVSCLVSAIFLGMVHFRGGLRLHFLNPQKIQLFDHV